MNTAVGEHEKPGERHRGVDSGRPGGRRTGHCQARPDGDEERAGADDGVAAADGTKEGDLSGAVQHLAGGQ